MPPGHKENAAKAASCPALQRIAKCETAILQAKFNDKGMAQEESHEDFAKSARDCPSMSGGQSAKQRLPSCDGDCFHRACSKRVGAPAKVPARRIRVHKQTADSRRRDGRSCCGRQRRGGAGCLNCPPAGDAQV